MQRLRAGRISQRHIKTIAALLFALLIAIAASIATYASRQIERARDARELLSESFTASAHTHRILSQLHAAESGQRGFLITGDEQFLEPYGTALSRLPDEMQSLRTLLEGQRMQLYRYHELQTLIDEKLRQTRRGILARQQGREAEATALVQEGRGRELMEAISRVMETITSEQSQRVESGIADIELRSDRAARLVLWAIAASFLIVAGAGFLVLRHLRTRLLAEKALQLQEHLVEAMRNVAASANAAVDFPRGLISAAQTLRASLGAGQVSVSRLDSGSGALTDLSDLSERAAGSDHSLPGLTERDILDADMPALLPYSSRGDCGLVIPVHHEGRKLGVVALSGFEPDAPLESFLPVARFTATELATLAQRDNILEALREALARHEAVFRNALDAIAALNPDGSIESFNPAAERLFGYSAEEVVGRHFSVLLDEGEPAPDLLDRRSRGGLRTGIQVLTGRRKDGTRLPMEVATSLMRVEDHAMGLAIARDISERRRIEQMKSEFVSTVSHELRTPLTSIAGSLGLLEGGAGGALPEKAARLIAIAQSNSERLVRLINDILDIEKIESGKMPFHFEALDPDALIRQTLEANMGFAGKYGVRLDYEPPQNVPNVKADPDRLVQAVTNLLSNAIKFSPADEVVTVTLSPGPRGCRISLRDRGPGIAEDFQNRLFDRFAQADPSDTRRKGGTGLGLAITREIVIQHGGGLSYDTAPGWGTEFHIDLPLAPSPAPAAAPAAYPEGTPAPSSKGQE